VVAAHDSEGRFKPEAELTLFLRKTDPACCIGHGIEASAYTPLFSFGLH